jgi:mono/diheme cytochrome c family protein
MLKPGAAWLVACGALIAALGHWHAHPHAARLSQAEVATTDTLRPVLDRYCITCHNKTLKTAGMVLDGFDMTSVGRDADTWERVARKLRTREMPPPGLPRPDRETYERATSTLEAALDAAALAHPDPGRVIVHRLNRTEYVNAVRDLLALNVDGRSLLPADEPDQQGFDNVAGVLSVSPRLLENYLSAAGTVSRLAVADRSLGTVENSFKIPTALAQDDRISDDLPFGSRGGISVPYHFPLDGEYRIKVLLKRQLYLYLIGMGEPHQVDIRLDGTLIKRFTIGGEGKGRTAPESFAGNTQGEPGWEVYMHTADEGLTVSIPVTAGEHDVGVSFVRRHWEPEGILQPPQRGFARTTNELYYGNPAVDIVTIAGPYSAKPATDTPSRKAVFVCRPATATSADERCARTILSRLARRAYRRPVTEQDLDTLLAFYRTGQVEEGFDAGIQRALRRMLASPSFLFRIEREPANSLPGSVYRLNDIDLASRLSFFLWSSIPDDRLLDAATRGTLSTPAVLEQQVKRMLADRRSAALIDNFVSQWLTLNKLAGVVPDVDAYPEFDENLRDAFRQETRLFVQTQLREDRSVGELLTANYTYLNERLARHYQIPNVYGSHFRRVTFADGRRGGLLGQGSILTVTSYPNRTSPVLRGRWLLDNVLGAPPPPPPPDVPTLKEGSTERPQSIREQMEAHRKNPSCAVCHVRMDPLGFSLENFDALGKWRTSVDALPVDASAALPDGTTFDGVTGLRQLMGRHQEDFARTFTQKLMGFALGRSVESSDLPAIRQITKNAAPGGYRWSSLIIGIARSTPFTMSTTRARDQAPVSTATAP